MDVLKTVQPLSQTAEFTPEFFEEGEVPCRSNAAARVLRTLIQ